MIGELLSQDQAVQVFGACAAALVILYWLKPRALRVVVPSLSLWRQHLGKRRNPRWRERLALLLQLIAAALILRALVAPPEEEPAPLVDESVPVVAVVDGSGSMRATGRLEAAAEAARELGGGLVLAGEQVRFLAQPGGQDLERGLAQLSAGHGAVDLASAVAAVRAQGHRPVVLSDRDVQGLQVVGPGTDDVAVGVISATTGTGLPPRLQVAVRITNHGEEPTSAVLSLSAEDERLGRKQVDLDPGATATARFTLAPQEARWLEARLEDHSDDLADNDVSFALVPPLRPAHVELVTPGNRFLEQVLAAMPGVVVRTRAPGSWRLPRGEIDLVVFDRCGPLRPLQLPSVYVAPPEGLGPWPVGPAVIAPVFQRWDYSHPVLQGVNLRHLTVEEAHPLSVAEDTRVLAATAEGPIVAVKDTFPRQLVIGFDLTRSDLPLSVAFPQLVYNLLLWARSDAVGDTPARVRTTTEGVPLLGTEDAVVSSLTGDGTWEPTAGLPHLSGLPAGVYTVETEARTTLHALYWDPEEHGRTDAGQARGPRTPTPEPTAPTPPDEPELPWWLLIAFGVLLLEFPVVPR